MRVLEGRLLLSPSDLSNFLTCRHRAGLELAHVNKVIEKPRFTNPYAAILQKHGEAHEQAYVASLRSGGRVVVNGKPDDTTTAEQSSTITLDAMRSGADVIVQARLAIEGLAGYADVLHRVSQPSKLGEWSYEAHDTKLARETKAGTILQLSAYSDMLAEMQGLAPDEFHVVTPVATERYKINDYAAYYRLVRKTLSQELAKGHERLMADYYPEPVEACDVCAWAPRCEARRRKDDHLSYIAGAGRTHRVELTAQGIATLEAAAAMPVPVTFKPSRGARETYARLGHQARVQHQQRTEKRPVVERLPIVQGEGLCRLPPPSRGDVFLDLEGARFARDGGREYLFGVWTNGWYRAWWALNDEQERTAFEEVVDLIMQAWTDDPGMHVYHFNHYEPTAFKKLMGRYVTRGEQLDRLLRGERFTDLYPIARQALRAGVESYSIKKLEQYSGYVRMVALQSVHEPKLAVEQALECRATDAIAADIRDAVQGYNEDDCRSTEALRNWLESLRTQWETDGVAVPRPGEQAAEPDRPKTEVQQRAEAIRARLLAELPADASSPGHADHPRWLLAYLVDWHRREVNASWWEFFRLMRLSKEDLVDERDALVGVSFVERLGLVIGAKGKPTKSVIDRYTYPEQEQELGSSGDLHTHDRKAFGKLVAHDRMARTIDVEKGPSRADIHPDVLIKSTVVSIEELQKSVVRLAERMLAATDVAAECGAQLLYRRPPRLTGHTFAMQPGETEQDFAIRIVTTLDRTTLAIQGPPGAGKTYIGAQMILALTRAGKKVGVTATSHKVIHNLLEDVLKYARPQDNALVAAKGDDDDGGGVVPMIAGNDAPVAELQAGSVNVLGGTAWLWARDAYAGAVDVLFVDEAGQLSLANVLAVSQAANSLVLLGDPQQLDQPEKASHPDGVGVSALEHVLGGHETMPVEQGIFLPTTWRMSPTLTTFTSEVFYEGKLTSKAGLEHQCLNGVAALAGSKLWMVPVEHDGNQTASEEEVEAVAGLIEQLLGPASTWIDEFGKAHHLTAADIRVVAPFNAQVNRIRERLGDAVEVGTVDKFQGQTCAVVIYSMTTSRPEDAPRGMEFLYSLNRLNVATSRARCAVFVVASPRLFEPDCRAPRQMKLANALCRYAELAVRV